MKLYVFGGDNRNSGNLYLCGVESRTGSSCETVAQYVVANERTVDEEQEQWKEKKKKYR